LAPGFILGKYVVRQGQSPPSCSYALAGRERET
jgi:hypothetical protein